MSENTSYVTCHACKAVKAASRSETSKDGQVQSERPILLWWHDKSQKIETTICTMKHGTLRDPPCSGVPNDNGTRFVDQSQDCTNG